MTPLPSAKTKRGPVVSSPALASVVKLKSSSKNGTTANVYGRPTTSSSYVIGSVPNGAVFAFLDRVAASSADAVTISVSSTPTS